MEDRNPSPPPEVEKDPQVYLPDNVGDTAISKQWVLATLMEIINEVEKHATSDEELVDVPDELQDSACKLWDLCMDQDVAVFLLNFDIIGILQAVILKSKSPRLTEISVGILGNMACSEKACDEITNKEPLRSLLLALLASPDTETLLELVRLLRVCLSNAACADLWVKSIEECQSESIENSQFILGSSTNGTLLRNLAEVFDKIFDASKKFLTACCQSEFIGALLESIEQINTDEPSKSLHHLCHPLHALHTISIESEGISALVKVRRSALALLSALSLEWMTTHPKVDYNNSMEMSSSEVSVSCCLSIASSLLGSLVGNSEHSNRSQGTTLQEVDDDDRAMLLKFARCVVSAKGVLSVLTVVSSLTKNEEEESQNEFKTPLHLFKNSPRITTPLLALSRKIDEPKSASATPVSESIPATPDRTPEANKICPQDGDRTPPADSPLMNEESPQKRVLNNIESSWREEPPATILCSLAKDLLQTVDDSSRNGDASPTVAAR